MGGRTRASRAGPYVDRKRFSIDVKDILGFVRSFWMRQAHPETAAPHLVHGRYAFGASGREGPEKVNPAKKRQGRPNGPRMRPCRTPQK